MLFTASRDLPPLLGLIGGVEGRVVALAVAEAVGALKFGTLFLGLVGALFVLAPTVEVDAVVCWLPREPRPSRDPAPSRDPFARAKSLTSGTPCLTGEAAPTLADPGRPLVMRSLARTRSVQVAGLVLVSGLPMT